MKTEDTNLYDDFYKVGIKILSKVQLENIFPNYNNLLNRIENYRIKVKQRPDGYGEHYQYNLMYDNVFSILGKRGTGKTSVAFTLQRMIEENKNTPYDVVLPIIIPEVIPDDCSALVWILTIVKENVEQLEKRLSIYKDQENHKMGYWSNCRYSEEEKYTLSQKVDDILQLLFANKYNPSNESSYYKAVGNSAKQAVNYYKFTCEIARFWDEWIKALQQLARLENKVSEDICPLIFFIFDDVDLEPQKVAEILSIIIKYLSHPNLIVITTADEELFLEVIENSLDKEIGRLPKDWRIYLNNRGTHSFWNDTWEKSKETDLITQTARMYLGKVLPTSTRYYLRLFSSAEQRRWFRLSDTEYLGESMCGLVDELLIYGKNHRYVNFLKHEEEILNFYLNFMGDTSRQIGNAFLGMKEFVYSLIDEIQIMTQCGTESDAWLDKIYNYCRYFLYVEINANHDLAEEIEHMDAFIDDVFWMEFNEWKLYINYSYLNDFLERLVEAKYDGKPDRIILLTLQLYSLLLLLENVLLILEDCIPGGITERVRIHGISSMAYFISENAFSGKAIFRNDLSADTFFMHYSQLLNKLCFMVSKDANLSRFNMEYMYSFVDYPYDERRINVYALQNLMEVNRSWFDNITGIVSMVYGNMYLIGEKEIENCTIYKSEACLTGYQRKIYDSLRETLKSMLNAFHLRKEAERYLEELEEGRKTLQWPAKNNFQFFCRKVRQKLCQVKGKQDNESYGAMEDIIWAVDSLCRDKGLIEILQISPMTKDMQRRMEGVLSGQEPVTSLLHTLMSSCERWDFQQHYLCLFDAYEWIKKLESLKDIQKGKYREQVGTIVNRLLAMNNFPDKTLGNGEKTMFLETWCYISIKELLRKIWNEEKEWSIRMDEESKHLQSIAELLENMDVVVDMNQTEEFEDALQIGILIYIIQGLQKLYLYQTIYKAYQNKQNNSSKELEKMKVRKGNTKAKNPIEKQSYYYKMFLFMNDIVEDKVNITEQVKGHYPRKGQEFLEGEEKNLETGISILRNFIFQSSVRERNRYIERLIKEVENEQESY